MDIAEWVRARGGIVHRQQILDAGIPASRLRATITRGEVGRVKRYWVATENAPPLSSVPPGLPAGSRVSAPPRCVAGGSPRESVRRYTSP